MYKQIYIYNGTPYLVMVDEYNVPFEAELKKYNIEEFTDVQPESGLYWPVKFDEKEQVWLGSDKPEISNEIVESEDIKPSPQEMMIAETQVAVAESTHQLKETQEMLAQTLLDNAEKENRIKMLEEQQAQMMLAFAEIKEAE
ncbi:TPA: hypothetical protein REF84_001064 [Staphylococcus pseudintermedius]|nr:hypothetical protein [Staphylococcus pseudintermedius]